MQQGWISLSVDHSANICVCDHKNRVKAIGRGIFKFCYNLSLCSLLLGDISLCDIWQFILILYTEMLNVVSSTWIQQWKYERKVYTQKNDVWL